MEPIYSKKAIMESESDWAQNKKLIYISQKNIRKSVSNRYGQAPEYFSELTCHAGQVVNDFLLARNKL